MKRTFIAIDIPDQIRLAVAERIGELRNAFPRLRVGWERPEKLHLTLKFLGDVEQDRLDGIIQSLNDAVQYTEPLGLAVSGAGVFPSTRKPRVLWLGITDADDRLSELSCNLEAAMENLGFPKEDRRFAPHLTIARIRDPNRSSDLAAEHIRRGFAPMEFTVSEVALYESKLLPTGSVYSKLGTYPLKG